MTAKTISPEGDNLIEAEHLRISFRVHGVKLVAVDGVDVTVRRGETVALVGESGAGKSTVARAMIRAYEPEGGSIRFGDEDITHKSERELKPVRRLVKMVHQDPYSSLNPYMSVEELIAEPLKALGWTNADQIHERVAGVVAEVGLGTDALAKRPEQFSGGQRQRIAIARAIATDPELLITDEPLSALDVSVQAQLINLLRDMQDRHGVAHLLISHDLALVNQIADRVIVVYLGRVVEQGLVEDVFSHPQHPYTVALLSAIPSWHNGLRTKRIVLKGEPPSALSRPTGCHFHPRCPIARAKCATDSPELIIRSAVANPVACHFPGELPSVREFKPNSALTNTGSRDSEHLETASSSESPPSYPDQSVAFMSQSIDSEGGLSTESVRINTPMKVALVIGQLVASRAIQLVFTVFVLTTALFFLLRLTGDPAAVIAGQSASTTELTLIKAQYGLNLPLVDQYFRFVAMIFSLNFGISYSSLQPALGEVWQRLPPTIGLTMAAMALNLVVSTVCGCVMGAFKSSKISRALSFAIFVGQGIPFYVIGLILTQIFAVSYHLLPSIGDSTLSSWLMPSVTLAWFLIPRLSRVLAVNVHAAMTQDYVRVARASGAGRIATILRHALPNSMIAASALAGTQFALLISGTLIVEEIFGWPGLGRLLIGSITQVDFPVVEAAVVVIAAYVYLINALTDVALIFIDPRTRKQ